MTLRARLSAFASLLLRHEGFYLLALTSLVLLFHGRALLPDAAFDGGDLRDYSVPLRLLIMDTVKQGAWPFWQRAMDCGFPLWGSSEAALFHPFTWLFAFHAPERGLTLAALCHLVLLALGTFLWLRRRQNSRGAAAIAALIASLGGFTTVHLDHWNFSASAMGLPWTLWGVEGLFERKSPGRFLATSLLFAACWLGGAGQIAYFASLIIAGYTLFRVLGAGRSHAPILLILPAGLLLAAPVLLAGAELNALGPRGAGITLEWAAEFRWQEWRYLVLMLLPDAMGPPQGYREAFSYWEMTGYVGLPTLVLSLGHLPRRMGWFFAVTALIALLTAFGTQTPLFEALFLYFPGFSKFRVATRALYLFNFSLAFLSAEALDAQLRTLHRRSWVAPTATALLMALSVAAALHFSERLSLHPEAWVNARWAFTLLAALVALLLLRRWIPPPVLALCWVLVVFLDLRENFADYMAVVPASEMARHRPPLPATPPGRVAYFGPGPNLPATQQREGVTGYSQVLSKRIFDLLLVSRTGHFSDTADGPLHHEYGVQRVQPNSRLFPLFAAEGVVVSQRNRSPGPFRTYAFPSALPLAFWTATYQVKDDQLFRAEIEGFNPQTDVSVAPAEGLTSARPTAAPPRQPARVLARTPNETSLEVEAPQEGLLVLLDPFFPGWQATLKDQPLPLLRANYAFMAVKLPAGKHTVHFRYRPSTLPLAIACVAAVFLAVATWTLLKRRSQRSAMQPSNAPEVQQHPR